MPISRKLDYVILNMIESSQKTIRAAPMNLGGVPGSGGGAGAPPGGFTGWLPQTRVAYDLSELETPSTSGGGSLLDNLNHIRYRLAIVEASGIAGTVTVVDDMTPATYNLTDTIHFSGGIVVTNLGTGNIRVAVSGGGGSALTVQEADGAPVISNVDKIIFSGMTVVDQGSGDAYVYPTATYFDSRYLKLDASNDPVTGKLTVQFSSPGQALLGVYQAATYGFAIDVTTQGAAGITLTQTNAGADDMLSQGLIMQRNANGDGGISAPFLELRQYENGSGIITGDWAKFSYETIEKFSVASDGTINIASGATYNINDVPHTHDIDAELAAIAGLTSAANKVPRFSGSGTAELIDVEYGTWTPTLTNSTNVAASVAHVMNYIRVGNQVFFNGIVEVDTTAVGAFLLYMSLPIASNFTTGDDANGNGTQPGTGTPNIISIREDQAGDRLQLDGYAQVSTNLFYRLAGGYIIK